MGSGAGAGAVDAARRAKSRGGGVSSQVEQYLLDMFAEMNWGSADTMLDTDEIARALGNEKIRKFFKSTNFDLKGNAQFDAQTIVAALDQDHDNKITFLEFKKGLASRMPSGTDMVSHVDHASPPRVAPSSLVPAAPAPETQTLSFEFDKSAGKLGFKVKANPKGNKLGKGKGFLIRSIDAGGLVEGKLAIDDLISRVNRRDASQLDDIKDIGKLLKASSKVTIDVVRML